MFRSIRWTLQLWHAAILLVALAVFGTALYLTVSRATYQAVDSELENTARQLAQPKPRPGPGGGPGPQQYNGDRPDDWHDGRPPDDGRPDHGPDGGPMGQPDGHFDGGHNGGPPFPPHESPHNPLADLSQDALHRIGLNDRDQLYFMIWQRDKTLIRTSLSYPAQVPMPVLQLSPSHAPTASEQQANFRQRGSLREAAIAGPFGTTVLVGRSVEREATYLRNILLILILAAGIVLAIGLIGGAWLSHRATEPIRSISQTARSISASEWSRRINVKETKSELGSLAQTLNEAFDRLETAFQYQVRFTADASHELRTPLSVIYSHVELALQRERTADEYRQTIQTCFAAARRMKSLVESLLVLARADGGKLDLRPEIFDLKDLAEECLELVGAEAKTRSVTLHSELTPLQIRADRSKLFQVLVNLLSNAIRYNRPGGRVELATAPDADGVLIKVSDTGLGITPEDQPHIFERFFRADKARSHEVGGSGLGLAICQSIVRAHGGTISVASIPGERSVFTVSILRDTGAAKV